MKVLQKCKPEHAGLGRAVSKLFSILIHVLNIRIDNKNYGGPSLFPDTNLVICHTKYDN